MSLLKIAANFIAGLPESGLKENIRNLFYQEIISERLIEYPLVFRHLPPAPATVLDVGCRYSNLVLQMAGLGYRVSGLDLQPYPYSHPNLEFIKGDIRYTGFPDNFFDCVTAVSTVEHIGLGFYESTSPDPAGDAKSIVQIHRILKPRGRLIFTAPFGQSAVTPSYRVYSQKGLDKLFKKFSRKAYSYFSNRTGSWIPCSLGSASTVNSAAKVSSMVLAVCTK